MKCPYCGHSEQRVLDSRPAREGEAIRRRRECDKCERRFTTFEAPEKPRLFVAKRSGGREEFDREKVLGGMVTACRKRPVTLDQLREAAARIERDLFDLCEDDVPSQAVGDRVMRELRRLDHVAFVRFASVYREFQDPAQFAETVRDLAPKKRAQRGPELAQSKL
ncbi:MAG: transcriptional repressor NrdR [Armatimonadetes bacterium]|nr:transcriptional repressor NrdR [Armatimonadota bacterium]